MNGGGWKCSDSHAVLPGGVSALLSNFLPLPSSQPSLYLRLPRAHGQDPCSPRDPMKTAQSL